VSPWSDLTAAGDTYETLAGSDPSLNLTSLSWSADAYAAPANQRHPYVSPVYGDYTKGFPPTLIQGGTREMFLSNFVRQYQAIRGGGNHAVLDLYEGMPHVFQSLVPGSPETQISVDRAVQFLAAHLD
jgi:acetyl esterase/lipase